MEMFAEVKSSLLLKGKRLLKESALELYSNFAEGLEMDAESYKSHFSDLGEILYNIESCDSLGAVLVKVEMGLFDQIGFQGIDTDTFLRRLIEIK